MKGNNYSFERENLCDCLHAGVSLESGRAGGSGLRDSVFANADDLAAAGPLQLGTAIQRPLVMGVFAADGGKLLGAEPFVVWIGNRPVKEIFHIAEGKPQPQQAFFISWEMLVTFIISQRKNIPAIRACVEALCVRYGENLGREYAFPTPAALSGAGEEGLRTCALGYRAGYVLAAARLVQTGALDLEALASLGDGELLEALTAVPGVGVKVASCVSLFGYHRIAAFPRDVWINRVVHGEKMADRDLLERFFALGDFEIGEKVQHLLIDTFDTALMDGNTDQRVYNALCHRKYMTPP